MSSREMVIEQLTARMIEAFTKGDLIDAQNMNAFIASLEDMDDEQYAELGSEECSGAIS